jgi:hypothetical protein
MCLTTEKVKPLSWNASKTAEATSISRASVYTEVTASAVICTGSYIFPFLHMRLIYIWMMIIS